MASGAVLGAAPDIGYSESDEIQLNEVNMHQLDDWTVKYNYQWNWGNYFEVNWTMSWIGQP